MKSRSRIVSLFLGMACIALLLTVGCGGGGGGGSDGTGLDPIEVEINAEIDTFLAGVNARNTRQAMDEVDSNLKYYRYREGTPDYSVQYHDDFKDSLEKFLTTAASISVSLENRGVTSDGETLARVRGVLVYTYRDSSGLDKKVQENCEMRWENTGRWGIVSLSSYNTQSSLAGLAFPPVP